MPFGDLHIHKITLRRHQAFWNIIDEYAAIDIRRLRFHPPLPQQLALLRFTFKQHAHNFTNTTLVVSLRNSTLRFHQARAPACGGSRQYFVWQIKRGSSLFVRISEHTNSIKLDILDEAHQLLKVFFSLAGKAGDERRAHSNIRNSFSYSLNQSLKTLPVSAALHQLQNVLRRMLQRHIEILHRLRLFSNSIQK